MFSTNTYQSRRAKLVENIHDDGILLFLTNSENPINFEHNCYPFRQDSTFLYYFGIKMPGIVGLIDLAENKTILFGNEQNSDEIIWTGKIESLQEKGFKSAVHDIQPLSKLFNYLQKALRSARKVHFLPPYQAYNKILLAALINQPIDHLKPSTAFIKAVVAQRAIKEEQEIIEIEKALSATVEMHKLAMRITKAGMKEYEIINAMRHYSADLGYTFAYPPIVTKYGEILHNLHSHHIIEASDMILNDAGCETELGYAADLTRTYPVSGTFSTAQREIYEIVLQAIRDSSVQLSPHIKFRDIHLSSVTTLLTGLKDIGLVKGNIDDAVANDVFTLFFQCGTGHMMGLDVHDMEDLGESYVGYTEEEPKDTQTFGWKSLRLARQLEVGHVVTVEPGLYFIPTLIDSWKKDNKHKEYINYDKLDRYRDFGGIRIEDNYLITKDGYRTLGPKLYSSVQEIEQYRQQYS